MMMMSPAMLLSGLQMAGSPAMQGKIVVLGGKAYMLEGCDPRSVYCNALDDFPPLAEYNEGPHVWKVPVETDPGSVDPWLFNVGGGIY